MIVSAHTSKCRLPYIDSCRLACILRSLFLRAPEAESSIEIIFRLVRCSALWSFRLVILMPKYQEHLAWVNKDRSYITLYLNRPKDRKRIFFFSYLNVLPVCQRSLMCPEPPWFLLHFIYKEGLTNLNRKIKNFFILLIQSFQSPLDSIKKSHPRWRMTLNYLGC